MTNPSLSVCRMLTTAGTFSNPASGLPVHSVQRAFGSAVPMLKTSLVLIAAEGTPSFTESADSEACPGVFENTVKP